MAYIQINVTTQTGLSFITGEFIQVINSPSVYIYAQVVTYNSVTGILVFQPISFVGTGTYTSWEVIASGISGVSGSSGTSGLSGSSGTSGVGSLGIAYVASIKGLNFLSLY